MREKILNHYFLSQPHQPFFVLAFVNALISMLLFTLIFQGVLSTDIPAKLYHSYSIIFLFFTPAFLAFLFTTFPRFSATEVIEKRDYVNIFFPYLTASILSYVGLFSSTLFAFSIMLSLVAQLGGVNLLWSIYKQSTMQEKDDQFWILTGLSFGFLAQALLFLSLWFPSLFTIAIEIGIFLYLFLVFFTVAQRMVPFFSHSPIEKHKERFKVIVGLLALHVFLETIQTHSSFLVDLFLAYLVGRELYRWKLPFPNPNPLVWILHIALFWIPVALLISALTNVLSLITGTFYLNIGIHTLALGFFLTMLIGFGTRVTIGHSGNIMQSDNYTTSLFYATQVVVIARIFTSLSVSGDYFMLFFNLSIALWLMLFIAWAYRFFSVLVFGKKL